MYKMSVYNSSLNLYDDLKMNVLNKLKNNKNDFIIVLPNENFIDRLRKDILKEYNSLLDFKIFTFDDLVNYKKIDFSQTKNSSYYSNLILNYSINNCIEAEKIENNNFYNSSGFQGLAFKFINYIKSSIIDVEKIKEKTKEDSSLFSIFQVYEEYNKNLKEFNIMDNFEKYYDFLESDTTNTILKNINNIYIAGFLDFRKIEYEIINLLQKNVENIDIFYEFTLNEKNLVFKETKDKLENFNFETEYINKRKISKKNIKLIKAEDKYLEVKRLAIEIKKNILSDKNTTHGIIINDSSYNEIINNRFEIEKIAIQNINTVKLSNTKIGKNINILLKKDISIKEYIIKNLKNFLIFKEPIVDIELENLIYSIELNEFKEIFNSNKLRCHDKYNEYYIILKKIYDIYSINEKDILAKYLNNILEEYSEENLIYSEFKIFINDLITLYQNIIEKMTFLEFSNYILEIINIFEINELEKYRSKIKVIDFNSYKVLNYDYLYFLGFDDLNYPKKNNSDFYFNNRKILKYRQFGFDVLTNEFKKSKDLLNFNNIIHECNNIYFSYEINKENILSEFSNSLVNNSVEENYFFKNYIKPDNENIINEIDKKIYLSSYIYKNNIKKTEIVKNSNEFINNNNDIYSSTKLETYLLCPAKYYYRYILKLENKFIDEKLMNINSIGIACHKTLEKIYREKYENLNEYMDNENICNILKYNLDLLDFNTGNLEGINTLKRYTTLLSNLIKNDIEYMSRLKYKIIPCEFEKNFEFNKIVKKEDFKKKIIIKGQIDRIDKDEKGNLYLVDYKLGKNAFKTFKDFEKNKSLQFPIYSLIGNVKNCRYLTINDAKNHEFFNMEEYPYSNINTKSNEEIAIFHNKTMDIIGKIIFEIERENYFIGAKDNKTCEFCQYKDICNYRG